MKKGDVIRQKCVNTTFYLTGILAHKVNNTHGNVVRTQIVKLSNHLSLCRINSDQFLEFCNNLLLEIARAQFYY